MMLDFTHLLAPFFWGLVAMLVLGVAVFAAAGRRGSPGRRARRPARPDTREVRTRVAMPAKRPERGLRAC